MSFLLDIRRRSSFGKRLRCGVNWLKRFLIKPESMLRHPTESMAFLDSGFLWTALVELGFDVCERQAFCSSNSILISSYESFLILLHFLS